MTSRTLVILGGALIVLALLAVYGRRDDAPPPLRSGEQLLPELEAALGEIDRVQVIGAGGETLATLERGSDDWSVAEKHGYRADITKIRGVLRGLAEARIVEQKTSNPAYYDRLGVDDVESDEARGVEVSAFASGERVAAVIVGDAVTDQHYVRVSGEPASHLVDVELDVPRDPVDWLDRTIVDIPSTLVASVAIEHPDGESLRIAKESDEQTHYTVANIPEGRELTYPGAPSAIANALRDLSFDDVRPAGAAEDAAAGATEDDSPADASASATVATLRTFDGLVVTATTVERDGESWVRFDASVASDRAGGDETGNGASGNGAPAGGTSAGGTDPAERARRIDARVAGWEYRIPSYQSDQLTQRVEDLLREQEDEDGNDGA